MSDKSGTRLRCPRDLRRYITKLLCKLEKLPDKDQAEKAGSISKLGDTWLRAWEKEIENEKIKKLEREIYAIKSGQPLAEEPARAEGTEEPAE
jgi:hypothetical protein